MRKVASALPEVLLGKESLVYLLGGKDSGIPVLPPLN